MRGYKIFWDPFACFHWTSYFFSDKSVKQKSHIYLFEQFSCSSSKHHTYYSYNFPQSSKFYQKKKATCCKTWAPALPLENWTPASTVVIEDGKGALQKNTGDRDSKILSDCSGFQQRTSLGSKNCWQSLGSCSAICHRLECNSSKLAGSHPHCVLLYFSILSLHTSQPGDRTAPTCKNTAADPKHFAEKAALLPPGSSGREATRTSARA